MGGMVGAVEESAAIAGLSSQYRYWARFCHSWSGQDLQDACNWAVCIHRHTAFVFRARSTVHRRFGGLNAIVDILRDSRRRG